MVMPVGAVTAPAGMSSSTRFWESTTVPPAGPMMVVFESRVMTVMTPKSTASPGCRYASRITGIVVVDWMSSTSWCGGLCAGSLVGNCVRRARNEPSPAVVKTRSLRGVPVAGASYTVSE